MDSSKAHKGSVTPQQTSALERAVQFGKHYTVFRTRLGSDVRETIAELPLRKATFPAPSWIHDFPCTQNHMVLPECPVYFDVKARA